MTKRDEAQREITKIFDDSIREGDARVAALGLTGLDGDNEWQHEHSKILLSRVMAVYEKYGIDPDKDWISP